MKIMIIQLLSLLTVNVKAKKKIEKELQKSKHLFQVSVVLLSTHFHFNILRMQELPEGR